MPSFAVGAFLPFFTMTCEVGLACLSSAYIYINRSESACRGGCGNISVNEKRLCEPADGACLYWKGIRFHAKAMGDTVAQCWWVGGMGV